MNTAIVYYYQRHGNTKKLLDAIAAAEDVTLINVTANPDADLSAFDRIGLASGIYFNAFAKQLTAFADTHLLEGRDVFFIYTHGAPVGGFLKGIREITRKKKCRELGAYHYLGFDTFGPFRLVGGIAKGYPTEDEIRGAVEFYRGL